MKKQKRPDADEMLSLCERVISARADWGQQVDELLRYYYFQELTPEERAMETRAIAENREVITVKRPDAALVVNKIRDLFSPQVLTLSRPPLSQSEKHRADADNLEKFCTLWLDYCDEQRQARGPRDLAWFGCNTGDLVGRVLFIKDKLKQWKADPDDFPLLYETRNPRFVYPLFRNGKLWCVFEQYDRTVADVKETYPEAIPEGMGDDDTVRWTEYWDATYRCYWLEQVPIAGGMVEHKFGCLPYAVRAAFGTPLDDPNYRARPLLAPVMGVMEALNLTATMQFTSLANNTSGALVVFSDKYAKPQNQQEKSLKLDRSVGSVNYLEMQARVEPIRPTTNTGEILQAGQSMEILLQRGTIPALTYGEMQGTRQAGYAISQLMTASKSVLSPLQDAIEHFYEDILRIFLTMVEQFIGKAVAGGKLELYGVKQVTANGSNYPVRESVTLEPDAIGKWYVIDVKLSDPAPQDEERNLRMAMEATNPQNPLMSKRRALQKYLNIQNPDEEFMEIMAEQAQRAPEVLEKLIQMIAIERGWKITPASAQAEQKPQLPPAGMGPNVVPAGGLQLPMLQGSPQGQAGGTMAPPLQSGGFGPEVMGEYGG